MKKYFQRFRTLFIITAIVIVAFLIVLLIKGLPKAENYHVRTNSGAPSERVYDYADLLTDEEENKLRSLIAEKEDLIGCDLVIVTLNQPLRDYALSFADQVSFTIKEDRYVEVFADNFYDNYNGSGAPFYDGDAYGYDKPWGDGALLVDNWDRSDSAYGYAYNWISTSGRVERAFSRSDIQDVIDDINEVVNDNPYKAYTRFVNDVADKMLGQNIFLKNFVPYMVVICVIALITALIYLGSSLAANKGKKTTTTTTYVPAGHPEILVHRDILIHSAVTHHKVSSSSGGGGGGHHISAGGHSHGGGGGHH